MSTVIYPLEESNGRYRPFIPIVIVNPLTGHKINTKALIDTGADACAFPELIATNTKHNLKGVGVINSVNSGIGGVGVSTWKHTFLIGLLNPQFTGVLKWTDKIVVELSNEFEIKKTDQVDLLNKSALFLKKKMFLNLMSLLKK
ncbi:MULTISPECIES: hypothetical protein [unclassified Flavobacterium]|uniref:hypothetical protein n=1 Tax=unclassified Flavobacterium TaxID=196869 RepID=UPI0025C396AC|nr:MULTISPECIES: hypothetical protein [unclassified Flavobacterium]